VYRETCQAIIAGKKSAVGKRVGEEILDDLLSAVNERPAYSLNV
jgi:hypothetical protein